MFNHLICQHRGIWVRRSSHFVLSECLLARG